MTEIRVVFNEAATVGGSRCIKPIQGRPCWLPIGHRGDCLPLPRARYLREEGEDE